MKLAELYLWLSACNNSRTTEWVFMKFYVDGCTIICWHIAVLIKTKKKIDILHVDPYLSTYMQASNQAPSE
jgi:hypothetical protein